MVSVWDRVENLSTLTQHCAPYAFLRRPICVSGDCVEDKIARNGTVGAREVRSDRSATSGKRPVKLDPVLKSWLDNVVVPALVRQYVAEMERSNRLATTGISELPSNQDGGNHDPTLRRLRTLF